MGVRFCMTNGNCQECAKLTFLLASTLSVFFSASDCLAQNTPPAPRAGVPAVTPGKTRVDQARELNRQGIELQSTGKLKEACDCYRRAILLNSQGAGYHNNLALALKDLGELTEAESEARIALKLRPQRADYHFNLGIILQRQKRIEESEAAFKEALSMDPSDTDCHYRLAQLYLGRDNFEQAREEMKLALLLKPDKLEYLEQLGDIYQKSNDLEQALYQYKLVMEGRGFTIATVTGELKDKIETVLSGLKAKRGQSE